MLSFGIVIRFFIKKSLCFQINVYQRQPPILSLQYYKGCLPTKSFQAASLPFRYECFLLATLGKFELLATRI
jgi:hypothetical protein